MDPQSQQAMNAFAGMGAGIILVAVLFGLACLAFGVYMFWRIFTKAGLSGPLALLVIVPFGPIIVLCILAFADWKVTPIPQYAALPPQYPPPPAYPPQYPPQFPPQGPSA